MRTHQKYWIIAFALGTGLSIGSCAPAPKQAPELDQAAIKAEVSAQVAAFWASCAEGHAGFDKCAAFFEDHPDFVFAANGVMWRSLPAATDVFRPVFEGIDHQVFDMREPVIVVLGPDLAHVSVEGTCDRVSTDGTSTGPIPVVATMVMVRSGGIWHARFYHESQVPPSTDGA